MRLLLDTHVFLWWMSDDAKLPLKIRKLIQDPSNRIFVSAASAWEIIIKKSIGKLVCPLDLEKALEENDCLLVSLIPEHSRICLCIITISLTAY